MSKNVFNPITYLGGSALFLGLAVVIEPKLTANQPWVVLPLLVIVGWIYGFAIALAVNNLATRPAPKSARESGCLAALFAGVILLAVVSHQAIVLAFHKFGYEVYGVSLALFAFLAFLKVHGDHYKKRSQKQ